MSLTIHPSVSVFAAVDPAISEGISKAIGHPGGVAPLKVKPASEAIRFKVNNS